MRANEDQLLAQRATWLVLASSFLFATFAIVEDQATRPDASSGARLLVHVIPIVGLSVAILAELGVAAAIYMLWALYRRLVVLDASPELTKVGWPSARRPVAVMLLGQLFAIVAPLGLAVVWCVLLAA